MTSLNESTFEFCLFKAILCLSKLDSSSNNKNSLVLLFISLTEFNSFFKELSST